MQNRLLWICVLRIIDWYHCNMIRSDICNDDVTNDKKNIISYTSYQLGWFEDGYGNLIKPARVSHIKTFIF